MFICVLFILPTAHPVNSQNMNYAVVAVGGILILVGLTWVFWGRYTFKGPVHTVDGLDMQDSNRKME